MTVCMVVGAVTVGTTGAETVVVATGTTGLTTVVVATGAGIVGLGVGVVTGAVTGTVGVMIGLVGVMPLDRSVTRARVSGPKYPVAGRPYADWSLIRAALVAFPKYVVSWPLEPGPVAEMVKPLSFRSFWRVMTSVPD